MIHKGAFELSNLLVRTHTVPEMLKNIQGCHFLYFERENHQHHPCKFRIRNFIEFETNKSDNSTDLLNVADASKLETEHFLHQHCLLVQNRNLLYDHVPH